MSTELVPYLDQRYTRVGPMRVALLGDSRNADSSTVTSSFPQQLRQNQHWTQFVAALSDGAIEFPVELNFAVSSTTAADMIASGKHLLAAASDADAVAVFTGTNSFTAGVSGNSVIASVSTAIQALDAAGKLIFLVAESPRGTAALPSVRLTSTQLREMFAFRNWALSDDGARALSPRVVVLDFWPVLADPSSTLTTGDALGDVLSDGLHFNSYGNWLAAQVALPVFLKYAAPQSFLLHSAADLFHASNPRGNLLANGMLGAGSAYTGNGFSGVIPTGFTATINNAWLNGGSPPSLVGAIIPQADGAWWQATITGTSGSTAGADASVYQDINLANVSAGDVIRASIEMEIDAGAQGLRGTYLTLEKTTPEGSTTALGLFASSSVFASLPGKIGFKFKTPPLLITGTETRIRASLVSRQVASATLNSVVRARKFAVRKKAVV